MDGKISISQKKKRFLLIPPSLPADSFLSKRTKKYLLYGGNFGYYSRIEPPSASVSPKIVVDAD